MKAGNWIVVAGVFAFLAVALGAFGAHALSSRFGDYEKGVWQTAVFYHVTHSVVILLLALGLAAIPSLERISGVETALWLFSVGILLFSGSLYALALSGVKILGAITPLGGVSFLTAWILVARAGYFLAKDGN